MSNNKEEFTDTESEADLDSDNEPQEVEELTFDDIEEKHDVKSSTSNPTMTKTTETIELSERSELKDKHGKTRGVSLCFDNISYFVQEKYESDELNCLGKPKTKKREKALLKNLSGSVRPGEFIAIMGASGAGKTTLLNFLSGRLDMPRNSRKEGQVYIDGKAATSHALSKSSAFCEQQDILMEMLTPTECLRFSAQLRLGDKTEEEKEELVQQTIKEFDLHKAKDTLIGNPTMPGMRGISGGERKRTAVSVELITDPQLVFVDEVSTGLDSRTALSVVKLLRELAHSGRTVICTIHQPSAEILQCFDTLMLLSDGEIAYHGPMMGVVDHFDKLGYPCPQYGNFGDHVISQLYANPDDKQEVARVKQIKDSYRESKQYGEHRAYIDQVKTKNKLKVNNIKMATIWTQMGLLISRAWTNVARNPLTSRARAGQNIITGLITGALYFGLSNNQSSIQDRMGALFFVSINQVMNAVFSVLLSFSAERAVLIKETRNNMYSLGSYFIGKIVAEFPFMTIFPALFCVIEYWMVGFAPTIEQFISHIGVVVLASHTGNAMGLIIGALISNQDVVLSVAPLILLPPMLLAGFFVSTDNIPIYLRWLEFLSLFKYTFQCLAIIELEGAEFTCDDDELIKTPKGNFCPTTTGQEVLDRYDIDKNDFWNFFWTLVGLYLVFRLLAFLALLYNTRQKTEEATEPQGNDKAAKSV